MRLTVDASLLSIRNPFDRIERDGIGAMLGLTALGMTIIIISGGIDLSVGAILAMGGLLATMAMERGLPIPVGVAIGVVAGLVCGFLASPNPASRRYP